VLDSQGVACTVARIPIGAAISPEVSGIGRQANQYTAPSKTTQQNSYAPIYRLQERRVE